MELKEDYLRTLEKVMASLQTERDCDSRTEIAKAIAGEYWPEISKALKTENAVSFVSGRIWNVRKEPLERYLLNVRMELDKFKQERVSTRKDTGRQIFINIVSGIILAVVSFWGGRLWERYMESPGDTHQKTEQSYNYEKEDSISNNASFKLRQPVLQIFYPKLYQK